MFAYSALVLALAAVLAASREVKAKEPVKISSPLDQQVNFNSGATVVTPIAQTASGPTPQTPGKSAWQGTINTAPAPAGQNGGFGTPSYPFPRPNASTPYVPGGFTGQGFPSQFAGGPPPDFSAGFGGPGGPNPAFVPQPGGFPNGEVQGAEVPNSEMFGATSQQLPGGPGEAPFRGPGPGSNFRGQGFPYNGPVGAVATNAAFSGPGGRRLFLLEEPTVDSDEDSPQGPGSFLGNSFGGMGSPFHGRGGFLGNPPYHFMPLGGRGRSPFDSPFGLGGLGASDPFPFGRAQAFGQGMPNGAERFGESGGPMSSNQLGGSGSEQAFGQGGSQEFGTGQGLQGFSEGGQVPPGFGMGQGAPQGFKSGGGQGSQGSPWGGGPPPQGPISGGRQFSGQGQPWGSEFSGQSGAQYSGGAVGTDFDSK